MPAGSRGPRGNGGDFDQMVPELPGLTETLERLRAAGPLVPTIIAIAIVLL